MDTQNSEAMPDKDPETQPAHGEQEVVQPDGLPLIYDPASTPPTGPMVPLTPEELERHEHGVNVPILDPGVMPGSPPVAF